MAQTTAGRPWMREITGVLQSMPLFEGIPQASLAEIAGDLRRRRFPKGARIFSQGDLAREFCLLTAGRLAVTLQEGDSKGTPAGVIEAPSGFGELGIVTRKPRTATVTALTESEVWALSRDRFDAVFARYPEMRRNLIGTLCERIQRKDWDILGQAAMAIEPAEGLRGYQLCLL